MNLPNNVNWNFLHIQKLKLIEGMDFIDNHANASITPSDEQVRLRKIVYALGGILHLLDNMQDEATKQGLFTYPPDPDTRGEE